MFGSPIVEPGAADGSDLQNGGSDRGAQLECNTQSIQRVVVIALPEGFLIGEVPSPEFGCIPNSRYAVYNCQGP